MVEKEPIQVIKEKHNRVAKVRSISLKVIPTKEGDFCIDLYNVMGELIMQGTKRYKQMRNAIGVARRLRTSLTEHPVNIEAYFELED